MTHQDKINYIRSKAIEANRSIGGDEISVSIRDFRSPKDAEKWCRTFENIKSVQIAPVHEDTGHGYTSVWCTVETLGRPIRLADVLLALSQRGEVTRGAKYLVNIVTDGNSHIDYRWNLLKDDVTLQSEECIEFLYQLLK